MLGILGVLYFAVSAAVAVLLVWALVLVIVFLRLRIAELRRSAGQGTAQSDPPQA